MCTTNSGPSSPSARKSTNGRLSCKLKICVRGQYRTVVAVCQSVRYAMRERREKAGGQTSSFLFWWPGRSAITVSNRRVLYLVL